MSEERTRAQIRIVGQWRRVRITVLVVLVLAVVQWPMRNAVLEADPTWSERWGAGVVGGGGELDAQDAVPAGHRRSPVGPGTLGRGAPMVRRRRRP